MNAERAIPEPAPPTERTGYRGYISSRPVRGTAYPQRVQNIVVHQYTVRHGLPFRLSLAEYAMPGCFMMLETLLDELPRLAGVIVFSMFMLPGRAGERARVYERVLAAGAHLHAALEDTAIRTTGDLARFEDTIQVANALRRSPLGGRFEKDGQPFPASDPFVASLMRALRPS